MVTWILHVKWMIFGENWPFSVDIVVEAAIDVLVRQIPRNMTSKQKLAVKMIEKQNTWEPRHICQCHSIHLPTKHVTTLNIKPMTHTKEGWIKDIYFTGQTISCKSDIYVVPIIRTIESYHMRFIEFDKKKTFQRKRRHVSPKWSNQSKYRWNYFILVWNCV